MRMSLPLIFSVFAGCHYCSPSFGGSKGGGGLCLGEVQGKSLEVTTALVGTELLECLGRYLAVAVCGTEGVRGSVEWL